MKQTLPVIQRSRHNYFFRMIWAHPRLYTSILLGICAAFLSPYFGVTSKTTQAIIGYDFGIISYLLGGIKMILSSTHQQMRSRALTQDEGKHVVLALVVTALLFSLCVIFLNLADVRTLSGVEKYQCLFMDLTTIVSSWFFFNLVFAFHYAHDYYFDIQSGQLPSLIFLPENSDPDYFDFLYFSYILGATAQTADVTLASKKMRRTVLLHSILAFFFNTTLLALTINIAAGLI